MWHVGGEEICTQGFGGKCEREISLGRPRCRWQDNIKMVVTNMEALNGLLWLGIGTSGGRF